MDMLWRQPLGGEPSPLVGGGRYDHQLRRDDGMPRVPERAIPDDYRDRGGWRSKPIEPGLEPANGVSPARSGASDLAKGVAAAGVPGLGGIRGRGLALAAGAGRLASPSKPATPMQPNALGGGLSRWYALNPNAAEKGVHANAGLRKAAKPTRF